MRLFLLDTDILTLFQKGHATVAAQVAAHIAGEIAISVVTVVRDFKKVPGLTVEDWSK